MQLIFFLTLFISCTLLITCCSPTAENNEKVSYYGVSLICEAAPHIGCASRITMLFNELQQYPLIKEVMVNRSGTKLAVVWDEYKEDAKPKRDEYVLDVFNHYRLPIEFIQSLELSDENYMFDEGIWYDYDQVHKLAVEEGRVIAARLVERVRKKISLSEEATESLNTDLADIISQCLVKTLGQCDVDESMIINDVISAGKKHLDEKGVSALRDAINKGIFPLPNER